MDNEPFRTEFGNEPAIPQRGRINSSWRIEDFRYRCDDKLDNKPLKNILFSLMVRKSFGGMKGDMRMLEGTIITYLNNPHLYQSRMIDKIKTIRIHKSLYINDFELSVVDFHCYPIILTILNQKFPQYSNEDLKKCIWKYSSSLNKRIIEESKIGEYWNIWLQIKTDYRIIAKELLTQY